MEIVNFPSKKKTPKDVIHIMTCAASKMVLRFGAAAAAAVPAPYDLREFGSSIRRDLLHSTDMTRNILLQVPKAHANYETCDLENACNSIQGIGCSGHGYCQLGRCLCDTKFWGPACRLFIYKLMGISSDSFVCNDVVFQAKAKPSKSIAQTARYS